jgi:hypothetical protein
MLVLPGVTVIMDLVVYVQLCEAKILRAGDWKIKLCFFPQLGLSSSTSTWLVNIMTHFL